MKYTKHMLKQFNIHALRSIARQHGIKSPTTKPKLRLIELIMQNEQSELMEQAKGRPVLYDTFKVSEKSNIELKLRLIKIIEQLKDAIKDL